MRRIFVVLIISLLFFTGCENTKENEKSKYLSMKSELLSVKDFTNYEDLNCDIVVNIDRINSEKYSYEMIISNPKENMNNIKALLIHNYYSEDLFPSIGLFNNTKSLKAGSDDNIILKGNIKTDKDIDNLKLKLKLLLSYVDDNGNKKDIYYKTTK